MIVAIVIGDGAVYFVFGGYLLVLGYGFVFETPVSTFMLPLQWRFLIGIGFC